MTEEKKEARKKRVKAASRRKEACRNLLWFGECTRARCPFWARPGGGEEGEVFGVLVGCVGGSSAASSTTSWSERSTSFCGGTARGSEARARPVATPASCCERLQVWC